MWRRIHINTILCENFVAIKYVTFAQIENLLGAMNTHVYVTLVRHHHSNSRRIHQSGNGVGVVADLTYFILFFFFCPPFVSHAYTSGYFLIPWHLNDIFGWKEKIAFIFSAGFSLVTKCKRKAQKPSIISINVDTHQQTITHSFVCIHAYAHA